ncbi:MAG TPA: hypothetical protein VJA27_02605 [Patescibacteria group bacterium]|nr:hypothetical protein [Patescibacteria group bacterium]
MPLELTREEELDVIFHRNLRAIEKEWAEIHAIVDRKYPANNIHTMDKHQRLFNYIIRRRRRAELRRE